MFRVLLGSLPRDPHKESEMKINEFLNCFSRLQMKNKKNTTYDADGKVVVHYVERDRVSFLSNILMRIHIKVPTVHLY